MLRINIPSLILHLHFPCISAAVDISAVISGANAAGTPGTFNPSIIYAAFYHRNYRCFFALTRQYLAFTQPCNTAGTIVTDTRHSDIRSIHTVFNHSPVDARDAARITLCSLQAALSPAVLNCPVIDHANHSNSILVHIPPERFRMKSQIFYHTFPGNGDKHTISAVLFPGNGMSVSVKGSCIVKNALANIRMSALKTVRDNISLNQRAQFPGAPGRIRQTNICCQYCIHCSCFFISLLFLVGSVQIAHKAKIISNIIHAVLKAGILFYGRKQRIVTCKIQLAKSQHHCNHYNHSQCCFHLSGHTANSPKN